MPELVSLRCPNCGAPIHAGDITCEYCSAALYAGQPSEVALPALANAQEIAGAMRERLHVNPYDGDAYYQLGLACFTLQLFEQAENAFLQAQRYLPGTALPHYFTARAILQSAENDILSIGAFRLHQIQTELTTASELDPNLTEAQAYLQLVKGLMARNNGDYGGAIPLLRDAVEGLPALAVGWKVLAACAFQTADYREAIRAGSRALQLRPLDEGSAYLVGAAHFRLGESDEMEDYARRVARLRGDADAWEQVTREYRGEFD
jgi:tetratricopeptide (TPR) repeat protein